MSKIKEIIDNIQPIIEHCSAVEDISIPRLTINKNEYFVLHYDGIVCFIEFPASNILHSIYNKDYLNNVVEKSRFLSKEELAIKDIIE
jgi:thiamine kinase-like enzyme